MKILCWNIRGLLSSRRRLKRIVRRERVDCFIAIEPFLDSSRIEEFARLINFQFYYAASHCKVWLFWNDSLSIDVIEDWDQYVYSKVTYTPWNFSFSLVAIYARHTRGERALLWSRLSSSLQPSLPVLIGGDFNAISSISEYRGSALPDLGSISDFSGFISDNSLVDYPAIGGIYTWSGVRTAGRVWKRLDRYLSSDSFRDFFSDVHVSLLNRSTSDHSPLLLCCSKEEFSTPRQFKFQHMWFSHGGFLDLVRASWTLPTSGGGMRSLAFKLKRLKAALQSWNRDVFGNIFDAVKHAEEAVLQAEQAFDTLPSAEHREALSREQAIFLQALAREETFWKQKARVKWLREGDANTKFFHSTVRDRHRKQRISAIISDSGDILTAQDAIQAEAVDFFKNLFASDGGGGVTDFIDTIPSLISTQDSLMLLAPVSREEVKSAVWSLDPDSASGPDGFTGAFFRHCWSIIHDDIYLATLDFMAGVPMPLAIASAQIVLIPKTDNPSSFAEFRPICLCTFASKIFTRILATRLGLLLPNIIAREQAGFVKGRSIHENVLLAFEMVHYIDKRCRGANTIVKLDMMKAFDRVSWPFLRSILLRFGFPDRFVNLVMSFLASTRLSILVNGRSCGFFQPSRGVKQGDPLSPLLFILCAEALSRALIRHVGTGAISPYSTFSGAPVVSHLAFADDIIIFVNGSSSSLTHLTALLNDYQNASGQKVNLNKSFFVSSRHCSPAQLARMSRILGMQRSTLPFRYLGVNLFKGRNHIIFYQHIIEKIDKNLLGWQRRLLSPGGRLILIKHVLSTIPLYTISAVQLPQGVIKAIERRLASFFWGTFEGKQKHHWASWDKLCLPCSEGGLGLRSLSTIQQAAAAKLWYAYNYSDTFWSDFMQKRYLGTEGTPSFSSLIWRRITQQSEFVDSNVADLDGEVVWCPTPSGLFTLASAYDLLRPKAGATLSSACIWARHLPLKLSIFMWKALRKFLSFPDCLSRFGLCLPSICPLCRSDSASLDHCLFSCPTVLEVWKYFAGLFGIALTRTTSFRSVCQIFWLSGSSDSAVGKVLLMLPPTIAWTAWTSYNSAIYENSSFTVRSLIWRTTHLVQNCFVAFPVERKEAADDALLAEGLIHSFAPSRRRFIRWIKWLSPPAGRLKLNTDASYDPQGSSGGACLRDSHGGLVMALHFPVQASSALEAEVSSLENALIWCSCASLTPSTVEVDSLSLVNFINTPSSSPPWHLRSSLSNIRDVLTSLNCTIEHIFREGNRLADSLATYGRDHSHPRIYSSISSLPSPVASVFLYDFRGFASPRSFFQ